MQWISRTTIGVLLPMLACGRSSATPADRPITRRLRFLKCDSDAQSWRRARGIFWILGVAVCGAPPEHINRARRVCVASCECAHPLRRQCRSRDAGSRRSNRGPAAAQVYTRRRAHSEPCRD